MNKRNLIKILGSVLFVALFLIFSGSIYYNIKLEDQIYERDLQIKQLIEHTNTIDSIVGYEYDSLSNSFSFSYRLEDGEILTYQQVISENDGLSIHNTNLLIMEIEQRMAITYYEYVLKLLNEKYGFNLKLDSTYNMNPDRTIKSCMVD